MAARPLQQRNLPFIERSRGRERLFKRTIVTVTTLVVAGLCGGTSSGRFHLRLWATQARKILARGLLGLEPDRVQIDAEWRLRRERGVEATRQSLTTYYRDTTEQMRELFRVVGMDPDHALIRYGRGDEAFVISSQVFEPDEHGRSYRFRPNTRSIWLRQITLRKGPFGLFQVLDTPKHRAAAVNARAIVDLGSVQKTNSWGLRGAEPDLSAKVRGIVLGDSFMQGMFNGDDDTPPAHLERYLRSAWKMPVSILNTGHIGYSPEQYYFSLCEYGERMRPQFVVVSVCPNDFGDGPAVLDGEGDWFGEAAYWLDQIRVWCRAHATFCLLVPVPTRMQIEGIRRDDVYPGQVCKILRSISYSYCDPLNDFVDEHITIARKDRSSGRASVRSALSNRKINDDHFSPRGAALWAKIVGRRLTRILEPSSPEWSVGRAPDVAPPSASPKPSREAADHSRHDQDRRRPSGRMSSRNATNHFLTVATGQMSMQAPYYVQDLTYLFVHLGAMR